MFAVLSVVVDLVAVVRPIYEEVLVRLCQDEHQPHSALFDHDNSSHSLANDNDTEVAQYPTTRTGERYYIIAHAINALCADIDS